MAQSVFHVCYHCQKRSIGCHSTCEAYQEEKVLNEKERAERVKQNDIDATLGSNAKHRMSTRNRNRKKFSNTRCPFC